MNMNGLLNGQNFFARNQSLNQFPQGPVVLNETNIKLQLARAASLINTVSGYCCKHVPVMNNLLQ